MNNTFRRDETNSSSNFMLLENLTFLKYFLPQITQEVRCMNDPGLKKATTTKSCMWTNDSAVSRRVFIPFNRYGCPKNVFPIFFAMSSCVKSK